MVKQTKNLVQVLRERLNEAFKERADVIDGMLVALLSRHPFFLLGPPGTAKSAITHAICEAIHGNYFQYLTGKLTKEEELFGPLSITALKADRYKRVTKGKIPEADIVNIDEFFKMSIALQFTLLGVMNEKKYFNDDADPNIPLQTLYASSNEIPTSEELAAVYDRFVLRYHADRIQQDSNMKDLMQNGIKLNLPSMSITQLNEEQKKAQTLKMPDEVTDKLLTIRREVQEQGFYVSDRKWMQSIQVIKAFAYLEGHSEVQAEDLEILENVLWHSPEQKKDVRKIIQRHCNPLGEKILKIMDALTEVKQNVEKVKDKTSSAFTTAVTEANSKAKTAKKQLAELGDAKANRKLLEALVETDKLLRFTAEHLMGLGN